MTGTYITIVLGFISVLIGVFARNFDYATGIVYTSSASKRAPRWLGRVVFIGFGGLLLISGLLELFGIIGRAT